MKKTKLLIIISVISLTVCLGTAAVFLLSQNPPKGIFEEGEYWGADFNEMWGLTKTDVDENGFITAIHYYDMSLFSYEDAGETKREVFYYDEDGKLTHSVTYEYDPVTETRGDAKYRTKYIYDGDLIIRGEVLVNGYPTMSYDEYEYTDDGKLKTVKRYEYSKLNRTYNFNGKNQPESYVNDEFCYVMTYDENGNLLKAVERDGNVEASTYELEYKNGYPSRFVFSRYKGLDVGYETELFDVPLSFDENGLLTAMGTTFFTRNDAGAVTRIENMKDGLLRTEIVVNYDAKGRKLELLETRYVYSDSEPLEPQVVRKSLYLYTGYDRNGNLLGYSHFENGKEKTNYAYKYNQSGLMFQETVTNAVSGKGTVYEYEYYPSGVLKNKYYLSDGGRQIRKVQDENGNLLAEYSGVYVTEYLKMDVVYPFSRVSSARASKKVIKETSEKYVCECEYGSENNLLRSVYSYTDGRRVIYEYGENEKCIKLTEYDKDGNIVSEKYYN